MTKIAVSRGHGKYTAGKRSPAGEREWYFNDKVARAFIAEIEQYEDVSVIEVSDPSGEVDTPLLTRTNKANAEQCPLYVAFHHNAYQGVWFNGGGSEVHVRPNASQAHSLASIVAPLIARAMGLNDRGVKVTNLHETREPHQLAILIEGGFMDSNQDILALRSDSKLKAQGVAVATGVAQYLGLKKKTLPADPSTDDFNQNAYGTYYKAENGTFVVGAQAITLRNGSPFLSAPSPGKANPGAAINYHEVCLQDGHVWVGYYTGQGGLRYCPVRTWNSRTGEVGPAWGTFR